MKLDSIFFAATIWSLRELKGCKIKHVCGPNVSFAKYVLLHRLQNFRILS